MVKYKYLQKTKMEQVNFYIYFKCFCTSCKVLLLNNREYNVIKEYFVIF